MHDSVLRVGHQSDEVLVGSDAEGERQQLVLQGVRAQRTLQVIWWAVLQAKPRTQTTDLSALCPVALLHLKYSMW